MAGMDRGLEGERDGGVREMGMVEAGVVLGAGRLGNCPGMHPIGGGTIAKPHTHHKTPLPNDIAEIAMNMLN